MKWFKSDFLVTAKICSCCDHTRNISTYTDMTWKGKKYKTYWEQWAKWGTFSGHKIIFQPFRKMWQHNFFQIAYPCIALDASFKHNSKTLKRRAKDQYHVIVKDRYLIAKEGIVLIYFPKKSIYFILSSSGSRYFVTECSQLQQSLFNIHLLLYLYRLVYQFSVSTLP